MLAELDEEPAASHALLPLSLPAVLRHEEERFKE
jgi:hypothetical protein